MNMVLIQNNEFQNVENNFDTITFSDWLNQNQIQITEPQRRGIRRNGTLYTCFQLDKFENYIKQLSFSSFQTEDIEEYESRIESPEFHQYVKEPMDICEDHWTDPDDDSQSEEDEELKNNDIIFTEKHKILNEYQFDEQQHELDRERNHNISNKTPEINSQQYLAEEELIKMFYEQEDNIDINQNNIPENDVDEETLTCIAQMHQHVEQWKKELQENNKKKQKGRNKTTQKRTNNRLTHKIIDHIEAMRETSYLTCQNITKEHTWINDVYNHYREQNGKITPSLIKKILDSNVIKDNNNHTNTKKTRKRKADNNLPEKPSKRRKRNKI